MILVAFAVTFATALGVAIDRRSERARPAAGVCLKGMLYGLIPFVAFVNFAHLKLTVGAGVGLGVAYCGLALTGFLAYVIGRRLGLARPSLGAVMIAAVVVNTGYLGYPAAVALLGHGALTHAVAYDQLVTGPFLFTAGFGIGAAFGERPAPVLDTSEDSLDAAPEDSGVRPNRWRTFAINPPLWAGIAGLIGGPAVAPHALVVISDKLIDAFLVVGFITVGTYLSSERREEGVPLFQRPDRPVLVAIGLRFTVTVALLGAAALAGLAIPSAYLLQAVMPSGVNGLIVGHSFGLDQHLLSTAIVWSTIAALAVTLVIYAT